MKVASVLLALACACVTTGCQDSRVSVDGSTTNRAPTAVECDEDDYPGHWTACPEAGWIRSIVETAGYEMADYTGSALVAKGNGDSFYIWASRGHGSLGGASSRGCRLGDTEVRAGLGAMADWRYWHAQGFTFWMSAGPLITSTSPDPCELGALVHESRVQPAPAGMD